MEVSRIALPEEGGDVRFDIQNKKIWDELIAYLKSMISQKMIPFITTAVKTSNFT
jgi:hypothetical protein